MPSDTMETKVIAATRKAARGDAPTPGIARREPPPAPPPPPTRGVRTRWAVGVGLVAAFVLSWPAAEIDVSRLVNGLPAMMSVLAEFAAPDFSVLPRMAKETLVTLQLSLVGTVLATLIALPLSFMAARNIVATPAINLLPTLYFNLMRSIDTLVFALIFVVAVGLGPFAGVLALTFHSAGTLGKLFAEAIEGIDAGPVEALKSVGASRLVWIRWAVLPAVLPYLISYVLYRFELNVRAAVVLGLVGAGGIGQWLKNYMDLHRYDRAGTVILVIVVLVIVIDQVSTRLRRAVLD